MLPDIRDHLQATFHNNMQIATNLNVFLLFSFFLVSTRSLSPRAKKWENVLRQFQVWILEFSTDIFYFETLVTNYLRDVKSTLFRGLFNFFNIVKRFSAF